MVSVSDIFLSGLGASIGGAIGGFLLQKYYSDRSAREKDHLSDLKEKIVNPLIEDVVNSHLYISLGEMKSCAAAASDRPNSLTGDFMKNHYPDIYSELRKATDLGLELHSQEQRLLNELSTELMDILRSLKPTEGVTPIGKPDPQNLGETWRPGQMYNPEVVYGLVKAILDGHYDKLFLTTTDYDGIPTLCFSNTEIFGSAVDKKTNINAIEKVRSVLIEAIDKIKNRTELKSYETKSAFNSEKEKLLEILRQVSYSTKLNFKKKNLGMRRKCSLV